MPFLLYRKCLLSLNSETYLTLHNDLAPFYLLYQNFPAYFQRPPQTKSTSLPYRVHFIPIPWNCLQLSSSILWQGLEISSTPRVTIASILKTFRRKGDDSGITNSKNNILQKKADCFPKFYQILSYLPTYLKLWTHKN